MPRKSQVVAAILNFLFPGMGFAYIGRPGLMIGGVMFFIAATADGLRHLPEDIFSPTSLALGLAVSGGMALLGSDVAEMFNRVGTGYRTCPACAEQVRAEAKVCKHCGRDLPPAAG